MSAPLVTDLTSREDWAMVTRVTAVFEEDTSNHS